MNRESPSHLITLVHGTFAPQSPWTLPNSYFRELLAATLDGPVVFKTCRWGGANDPLKRHRASIVLGHRLRRSLVKWPQAAHTVVAHSHAGNVVALALRDSGLAAQLACVVTVGTPFLRYENRQWIGHYVASHLPQSGFLFQLLRLSGVVSFLERLNRDVIVNQKLTHSFFIPQLNNPDWLALIAQGDEAGIGLRIANFVGKTSFLILNPLLIAIAGVLITATVAWIVIAQVFADVPLRDVDWLSRFMTRLATLLPEKLVVTLVGVVFLVGAIPLFAIATIVVRLFRFAFGGHLAQAAAWRVIVSSFPPSQVGTSAVQPLKLIQLFSRHGFWRRVSHLLRFGLLHGIVFSDSRQIQQIVAFIQASAHRREGNSAQLGNREKLLDPKPSMAASPETGSCSNDGLRWKGSWAFLCWHTALIVPGTIAYGYFWNMFLETTEGIFTWAMIVMWSVAGIFPLAAAWWLIRRSLALVRGAELCVNSEGVIDSFQNRKRGLIQWKSIIGATADEDNMGLTLTLVAPEKPIEIATYYFAVNPEEVVEEIMTHLKSVQKTQPVPAK